MHGDQRAIHALNRFTFGPRPGDIDAARAMGLDNWFEAQLHPERIDQSTLNTRLAQFPAMQSNVHDLLFRIPSNATLRQAIDGHAPVPSGSVLHAIYSNQIYRMQKKPADPAQPPPPAMDNAAVAHIVALAPQQRIAKLASLQPAEFDSFVRALHPPQRQALIAGLTPEQREVAGSLENPERVVTEELLAQRLTRDIVSEAQLQEVMTDFWFNHFNIYIRKDEQMPYYLAAYERDSIRPLALGKFEDLLEAVAHSPAMMLYLDNAQSMGPDSLAAHPPTKASLHPAAAPRKAPGGLNENYARELMELHTLGVNGGYTQADVIQVARVLTGWTVDKPQFGGGFLFTPNRHEPGEKIVLGEKIPEGGEAEGLLLLHRLAMQPATARFLAHKLAVRFVSDNPPATLEQRLAKTYLSTDGDISAVLRTLFHSHEFWSAGVYRAKVKTPLEFVVSAVRASNAQVDNFQPLTNALREMGMPLYGSMPPTGYKWDAADWVSTAALVDRMNFALALAANRLPGITTAWQPVNQSALPPSQPEAEEARLERTLLTGGASVATRSATLDQFHNRAAQNPANAKLLNTQERQNRLFAGLLLGSPEFQRR
ncbi:MAG: DUF1800 domain-containing protein [Chthoniobacter sp.]|nr:DUF1800 domain-containing protein [Chthoniobacter sp.]